jgi:hypothetical protein
MNSLTLASPSLVESRWVQFFKSAHQGSRALSISAWAMVLAFAICSVLQWLDPREFNGINLWVKPGKFYISMALHFFTVAWALSLVDVKHRASRVTLWMIAALVFCAWAEHAYITYRAAMGEASHFNVGTPLSAALYSTMAIFAIVLVIAPAVIGLILWRKEPGNLWAFGVAIGFSIAAVLSIVVGNRASDFQMVNHRRRPARLPLHCTACSTGHPLRGIERKKERRHRNGWCCHSADTADVRASFERCAVFAGVTSLDE